VIGQHQVTPERRQFLETFAKSPSAYHAAGSLPTARQLAGEFPDWRKRGTLTPTSLGIFATLDGAKIEVVVELLDGAVQALGYTPAEDKPGATPGNV
jgi:hypothetical protein